MSNHVRRFVATLPAATRQAIWDEGDEWEKTGAVETDVLRRASRDFIASIGLTGTENVGTFMRSIQYEVWRHRAVEATEALATVEAERDALRQTVAGLTDERDTARAERDAAKADRREADHALVDKYRNPTTGEFRFPTDVARIIRRLEAERDAAVERAERAEAAVLRGEALQVAAYRDGAKRGWNLCISDDDAAFARLMEDHEYLRVLAALRAGERDGEAGDADR